MIVIKTQILSWGIEWMPKIILVILLFMIIAVTPAMAAVEEPVYAEEHFFRARVLEVREAEEQQHEYFTAMEQEVVVELTSGPFRGEILTIYNSFFAGDPVYDFVLEAGQKVIVVAIGDEGTFDQVYVQDLARDQGVFYLIAVFMIALLVVGRMKGLKTIITLVATIFLIF